MRADGRFFQSEGFLFQFHGVAFKEISAQPVGRFVSQSPRAIGQITTRSRQF
jgi:hypothetical protein